jgi:hypothetical protein
LFANLFFFVMVWGALRARNTVTLHDYQKIKSICI